MNPTKILLGMLTCSFCIYALRSNLYRLQKFTKISTRFYSKYIISHNFHHNIQCETPEDLEEIGAKFGSISELGDVYLLKGYNRYFIQTEKNLTI